MHFENQYIKTHIHKTRKLFNNFQNAWLLPCLLFLVCHGAFWLRGGYADDFATLAYVTNNNFLENIVNWSLNSRWSNAIMASVIFNAAASIFPGKMSWWLIHLVGVVGFIGGIILIDKVCKRMHLSMGSRMLGLTILSVHPLKAQAVLWPSTIVGYLIPLTAFIAGIYIWYQYDNRRLRGPFLKGTIAIFCFLLAAFSLEQFLPLILLFLGVCSIREYQQKNARFISPIVMAFVAISFVAGTFFLGNTSSRAEQRWISFDGLSNQILKVIGEGLNEPILYPLRLIFDPYWIEKFAQNISYLQLLVLGTIVLLATWIVYTIWNVRIQYVQKHDQTPLYIFIILIFWGFAWSPFFIVHYYFPPRVHFIPLVFFSLALGVAIDYIGHAVRSLYIQRIFAIGLFFVLTGCALSSCMTELDFQENWSRTSTVEKDLRALNPVSSHIEKIHLVGLPRSIGPAPSFVNDFSLSGMLRWLMPEVPVEGTTKTDLIDLVPIIRNKGDETYGKVVLNKECVLIWNESLSHTKNISIFGIQLAKACAEQYMTDRKQEKRIVIDDDSTFDLFRIDIDYFIEDSPNRKVEVSSLFASPDMNLAILVFKFFPKQNMKTGEKVIVHVKETNGMLSIYDFDLNDEPVNADEDMWRSLVIQKIGSVKQILIGMENQIAHSSKAVQVHLPNCVYKGNRSIIISSLSTR